MLRAVENPKLLVGNVTSFLTVFLIFILTTLITQFYWKRRRLYAFAAQLPGIPCLPIIGNCQAFVGVTNSEQMYDAIIRVITLSMEWLYKSPAKFLMGPTIAIFVSHPDDLQVVLNSPDSLEKAEEFYQCMKPMLGYPLLYKPVKLWKPHRRTFHPAFSRMKCFGMVKQFSQIGEDFLYELNNKLNGGVISSNELGNLLDIHIVRSVLANLMGVQSYDYKKIERSVCLGRWLIGLNYIRMVKFWLHSDFIFRMTKAYHDEVAWINEGIKIYEWFLESRREHRHKNRLLKERGLKVDEEVLFSDILLDMQEKGEFTERQVKDELLLAMAAGTDTSTFGTQMTLLMIAMYPEVQEKLYEEVQSIFQGSDRLVTADDLKKTRYLDMVNKETMRLYPPIPVFARRVTRDLKLQTCTVPAGCVIFPAVYATHHHPELWPEPDKFDPERFHPDNKRHPYSYIPFSAGPRNCIGYEFASFFMKTMILMIMRKYRVSTECKHSDIKLNLILTAKLSRAKPIIFHERENNNISSTQY